MHSKVPSDWMPSYDKAPQPVLNVLNKIYISVNGCWKFGYGNKYTIQTSLSLETVTSWVLIWNFQCIMHDQCD